MQQQLYGLPKAGFEVHSWYPRIYQTSDGTLASKGQHIKLRPPAQQGSYILIGPWCFANANVVLDGAGTAAQAIFVELPVPPHSANDPASFSYGSINAGSYWFQRTGSSMSQGVVSVDGTGNFPVGVLRPSNITSDGGFSTVTLAAGDRFAFNFSYPYRV